MFMQAHGRRHLADAHPLPHMSSSTPLFHPHQALLPCSSSSSTSLWSAPDFRAPGPSMPSHEATYGLPGEEAPWHDLGRNDTGGGGAGPAPTSAAAAAAAAASARTLLFLCVFRHRQHAALLKSVQVSSERGRITSVCQRFTLLPGSSRAAPMEDPITSLLSKDLVGPGLVASLKLLSDNDGWDLLLDYGSHTAPVTSVPPLLSPSINKVLAVGMPLLARDLELVESVASLNQQQQLLEQQQQMVEKFYRAHALQPSLVHELAAAQNVLARHAPGGDARVASRDETMFEAAPPPPPPAAGPSAVLAPPQAAAPEDSLKGRSAPINTPMEDNMLRFMDEMERARQVAAPPPPPLRQQQQPRELKGAKEGGLSALQIGHRKYGEASGNNSASDRFPLPWAAISSPASASPLSGSPNSLLQLGRPFNAVALGSCSSPCASSSNLNPTLSASARSSPAAAAGASAAASAAIAAGGSGGGGARGPLPPSLFSPDHAARQQHQQQQQHLHLLHSTSSLASQDPAAHFASLAAWGPPSLSPSLQFCDSPHGSSLRLRYMLESFEKEISHPSGKDEAQAHGGSSGCPGGAALAEGLRHERGQVANRRASGRADEHRAHVEMSQLGLTTQLHSLPSHRGSHLLHTERFFEPPSAHNAPATSHQGSAPVTSWSPGATATDGHFGGAGSPGPLRPHMSSGGSLGSLHSQAPRKSPACAQSSCSGIARAASPQSPESSWPSEDTELADKEDEEEAHNSGRGGGGGNGDEEVEKLTFGSGAPEDPPPAWHHLESGSAREQAGRRAPGPAAPAAATAATAAAAANAAAALAAIAGGHGAPKLLDVAIKQRLTKSKSLRVARRSSSSLLTESDVRRAESDPGASTMGNSQCSGLEEQQLQLAQAAALELRSSPSGKAATERLAEMAMDELSQYFLMPITAAAKRLGVGLTVLKKRCRELEFERWPHRMLMSLDSLIANIQDLAKGPDGTSSEPVLIAVQELQKQRALIMTAPALGLGFRTKRLRQACFKAQYKRRCQANVQEHQSSQASPSGVSKNDGDGRTGQQGGGEGEVREEERGGDEARREEAEAEVEECGSFMPELL
eukprot:jgi/Mesen1/6367/ME000328S05640